MPSELKFNVGMNKTEFMTGSKEVARAIASLKTTVMQAGKSMNSSAAGYGTAMRQYTTASREASASIRNIKTQIDTLRQSTTAIKGAADAFRTLQERIDKSEKGIEKMRERMKNMETSGGKYSTEWNENQSNITAAGKALTNYKKQYDDAIAAQKKATQVISTHKNADGTTASNNQMLEARSIAAQSTKEAQDAAANIKLVEKELETYKQERDRLMAEGKNVPSEEWQALSTQLDNAQQSVANMEKELAKMKKNQWEDADQTSNYTSQVNAVKSLEAALDAAQSKKNELIKPPYLQAWDNMTRLSGLVAEGFGRIQNAARGALYAVTHPIQAIDRALGTVIAKVGQTISSFARMAGSSAVNFLKRLASEAKNAAIQLAKMAANAVTSGFKKVASGAAAAAKGVLRFNRAHNNTGNTLKMGLRNILRYAFGIRSMFFLFRRLRAAISEGFGELKKQNPEVKASLDSLSASFNGLKASLASAFAPILTAVAPALTTLINMLTAAMNAVAAFMAALGGGKTYSKAVSGIKGVGGAAGGAGKKVKELKRELASFDELTIINDQNKSGGGGGGGGGGSALKYQTEQIPGAVQDFVDSLKKAWEEGDYTKVGEIVAGKINGVFESALELITWENVEDKVEAGVSAVAGVFNGLTDPRKGINFKKIGITFSEGVRTLINSIDRLVNKISTANIGIAIANFFNGILSNSALFEDAKKGLDDVTTAVTNFAAAFLENFDEATLAQRIRETLGDASMWEGIGEKVWNVITLAFNKTGNFLNVLLGGENRTQDPNVTRMMRQKPKDIVPEFQIDESLFDDLAENFGRGINAFVEKARELVESANAGGVASAITKWLFKVNNTVSWDGVGSVIGASLRKVFDVAKVISKEIRQNASTLGTNLASAINAIIKEAFPEGGGGIGKMFSDSVISAFDFVTAFMKQFDEQSLIDKLKTDVDWDGIANAAWEAFKTAVEKLGNFLTLLFGGELDVTETVPDFTEGQKNRPENRLMRRRRSDVSIHTEGEEKETQSALTKAIGNTVSAVLAQIDEWVMDIDWPTIGAGLHDFLVALPWDEWGEQLANGLRNLLTNLDDFASAVVYGENYQENELWRRTHAQKAAKYDAEKSLGSERAFEVLSKRGLTVDDYAKIKAAAESSSKSDPAERLYSEQQQALLKDIEHELNVADAPEIVKQMRENGANEIDISAKLAELDITVAEGLAARQGLDPLDDANLVSAVTDATRNVLNKEGATAAIEWLNGTGLTPENLEAVANALGLNTDALNNNTNVTDKSNTQNLENDSASALFDKAMELIKSGTNRDDALKNLEAGGASPDKLSAVDEALDHVHHELLGWVEDDKVKQILDAANKTSTISPEESKAVFDAAAQEIHDAEESLSNASEDWEAAWRAETEDYVRAREEETTQAGEFLRETYGSLGDLITGRAHAEEGQGVYSEDFFKNMEAQEQQTKESKKNTKELKKNTKKRAEVDVNYEGAGFDTSGEKPTLNVGVNFAPNGEEASEENTNGGLLGWLQTLLDPGVSVETKVEMIKEGWTSFLNFLGIDTNNPLIQTAIQLIRNNFESFLNFLGVDTSNPLIKTIIDLVSGKKDSGAEKALNAGGTVRDAIVNTLLHKGTGANWVAAAWTALTKPGNSPISTVGLVAAKGAAWVANAWTALTKTGNSPISTVGLAAAKGADWVENAWTALTKTKNSATSTIGVKQSDKWNDNAFTALTKTENSVTSTVKLKKATGKNWSDKAYKMATETSNTITTKLKLAIGSAGSAVKNVVKAIASFFGWDTGGVISGGIAKRFASGGAIMRNGRASWWNSVNKYAAGTTRAHGTVFVAGENGPEIMGHVNGRTEILNKSQLADAMYGAVVAGMSNAVNALGSYLANRMATCTNAIVSTISANSDISALAGMNYYAPAMATGGIMPYDVAMQISRSAQDIQNTLNANNEDLIQAMVSAMGNAANSIVQILQRQMMQNNLGNRGNRGTDAIDVINRQSLMYGKSPLKGV